MGNIIRLPRDRHHECQLLLPWYVTDRLDAEDRARVEAHLRACERCRADLRLEQQLEAEFPGLPIDAEHGWAQMRRRIEEASERETVRGRLAALGRAAGALPRASAPWLGWAAAAGMAVFSFAGALAPRPQPAAPYHALSSPAPRASGDIVVVFRPDAREQTMAEAIRASGARLADGPTAAGAYVLRVPAAERDRALLTLRARDAVALAEPIDAGATP